MKYKRQYCHCSPNSGEGSALIIILAILSIAVPIGVGYSYYIFAVRTTASNYLDKIQSRQLADAAFRQAIVTLQTAYNPGDGTDDEHDIYPATVPTTSFYKPTSGSFADRQYLCSQSTDNGSIESALAVQMGDYSYLPNATLDVSDPGTPTDDDRGFIPVVAGDRVIGRFAYMIIDESGKLDPNTTAMENITEATGSVTRTGELDSEICLEDVGLANYDDYLRTTENRWHSTAHIAREIQPADFESVVIKTLFPYGLYDDEYWNDHDNDGVAADGEIIDRLDVTDVTDMVTDRLYKAFVAPDDPDSAAPDVGDLNDDNDCPWIKKLDADGVCLSGLDRRRAAAQVAVNMMDYVDGDDMSTSAWVTINGELSLSDPGAANTEVKVVGRENQFGVSEIAARVVTQQIGGLGVKDLQADVYFKGEIFYPAATGEPLASHTLNLTFSMTVDSDYAGSKVFFNNVIFNIPLDATTNEDGGTLWYSNGWKWAAQHIEPNFIGSIPLVNDGYDVTVFQYDALMLGDGSTIVDQFPAQPFNSYWWNWSSTLTLTGALGLYATLQAHDPSNNDQDETGPATGYSTYWDATANLAILDVSTNIGQLTRMWLLGPSTLSKYNDAAVKNAAFERVGEIGRVGSYRPGRSLRLWAADTSEETETDTYLLDMFKAGVSLNGRGGVNANAINEDVLTALLKNTTTVAVADAVNAVIVKRNSTTFNYIGDFFNIAGLSGADDGDDAIEEAMVEKVCELLQVRHNWFTMVVNAQAVEDYGDQYFYKDLNGDGDTYDPGETILTTKGVYDHNGDKILSSSKILAVVYRDALTNEYQLKRFEYLK